MKSKVYDYQWKCRKCGKKFSTQDGSLWPLTPSCPHCEGLGDVVLDHGDDDSAPLSECESDDAVKR